MSLVIVANRLPVAVAGPPERPALRPADGGLVAALRGLHGAGDTRWVGWLGDPGGATATALADELAARDLHPVALTTSEVARYYDGFANGVLWPSLHYLIDRLRRDTQRDWEAYQEVNQRFADAAIAAARPGDRIWIHDYHLMLVPELIRRRMPEASIGFFLHTPFPAVDVFRILPWREPLLRGVLAADLIGCHTAGYAEHLRAAAVALLGATAAGSDLALDDRVTRVDAFPIGIDAAEHLRLAASPEVAALAATWRKAGGGRRIVLGLDRLDYTKGFLRRLLAFERLLEGWPAWREQVQLIQVAVPTRDRVDEYAAFRREVNELVGRINGRFSTPLWTPIQFLHRTVNPIELAAMYRAADVMLVTPLRDGMNLVAKEYCAAKDDGRGVLVLSELAGAAEELLEALLVNPYDLDAVAAALARALAMPIDEQRARMTALRATVLGNDAPAWAERFLTALAREPATASAPTTPLAGELHRIRTQGRRLIVVDYDGTLVPFAATPDLAVPDPGLRELLRDLAAEPTTTVAVVSGRPRAALESWFGDLDLALAAEHGAWWRWPGDRWQAVAEAPAGLAAVTDVLARITRQTPGSRVEVKERSVAWHYRLVDPLLASRRRDDLIMALAPLVGDALELLEGARVLEVRGRGIDKGGAVRRLIAAAGVDEAEVVIAGDDVTDEDMFAAVGPAAVTIRVGTGLSRARFRVVSPAALRAALGSLR